MAANLSMVFSQTSNIRQYEGSQWRIDIGRTCVHPFDPAEISVEAEFFGPSGDRVVVPAFWDEPANDAGAFFVRFAPPLPGKYSMIATMTDVDGRRSSTREPFTVHPAACNGFVRRAANHRYFQFDSGMSFFPVGLNLCWPAHSDTASAAASWYDHQFATLAAHGGNYARVWMARPGVSLEGVDQKLNRYSMPNAKFFDDVLAAGEAHGISIMLTLVNYREFIGHDMWGAADWPNHPYHAARGGPARRPVDFFIEPAARRLFKARLRYLVARYSAYRSLAFWEFFNEQEQLAFAVPAEWNVEMSAYLRQIDPARHLITTSSRPPADVWQLPQIDLTQTHLYGDGTYSDQVATIASARQRHERFDKPHLIGEIGIDFHGGDAPFDPCGKGTAFHNSLWAAMATGHAGTAAYWWWDTYIEPMRLWREFKPISDFVADIDWANRDYRPIDIDEVWRDDGTGPAADLTIATTGDWGDTNCDPIVISSSGRPSSSPTRYLCGPHHKESSVPLLFDLTLPEACSMRLSVVKVSHTARLRESVDGKPVRDFLFSALPGAANSPRTEIDTVELPMPAGHHRITLQIIDGDWIELSKILFTNAVDAKYAHLRAYAVQDASTKDTLLWLLDTRSNWKDDQAGDPPLNAGVRVVVPNITSGEFDCTWFDTRTRSTVSQESIDDPHTGATLKVPPFTRDIALRITPR